MNATLLQSIRDRMNGPRPVVEEYETHYRDKDEGEVLTHLISKYHRIYNVDRPSHRHKATAKRKIHKAIRRLMKQRDRNEALQRESGSYL